MIPSGAYPVGDSHTILEFAVTISTPNGDSELKAEGGLQYEIAGKILDSSGDLVQNEAFKTISPSVFGSDKLRISHLFLRTPYFEGLRPDKHFRFGDANNIWWWLKADRKAVATIEPGSQLFPDQSNAQQVWYAPCVMSERPDDSFRFSFLEGGYVELTVRTATASVFTGRYVGRTVSAFGTFRGREFDIVSPSQLGFYGSTDAEEPTMPGLAVRTSYDGESCGFVFDPYNWIPGGWGGWAAYEMTCDEKLGTSIDVAKASYPEKYVIP